MEQRKLGILLVIISLVVGGVFLYYTHVLSVDAELLNCSSTPDCMDIDKELSVSYFAIGVFSFLLALGFYLLFLNPTESALFRRLESHSNDERFEYALGFLDPFEAKVLRLVREQDGITQHTLRIRTDMSKAKLSYVLQDLEKRDLIRRESAGKSLRVWMNV